MKSMKTSGIKYKGGERNMRRYQSNSNTSSGTGIPTVVLVVFIILKLVGVINWSWWWVLSPLWISAGLWLVVAVVVYGTIIISRLSERKRGKK